MFVRAKRGGHIKGLDRSRRLRAGSTFGAARRRALHAAAATTLLSLVAWRADAAPSRRPNVLVLLSDDQHHDTIHALGQPGIRTPNLDRLAGRGFAFTHAFSMGSITEGGLCSPSRAMLLTGRPVMARAYFNDSRCRIARSSASSSEPRMTRSHLINA
jgi:hypothetical protein